MVQGHTGDLAPPYSADFNQETGKATLAVTLRCHAPLSRWEPLPFHITCPKHPQTLPAGKGGGGAGSWPFCANKRSCLPRLRGRSPLGLATALLSTQVTPEGTGASVQNLLYTSLPRGWPADLHTFMNREFTTPGGNPLFAKSNNNDDDLMSALLSSDSQILILEQVRAG